MQASKIKIGDVFAIRTDDGKLMPFSVTSVTTTRTGPHSADFSSTVNGWMLSDDRTRHGKEMTIKPEKLLGYFEEHVELVARKEAADAETKQRSEIQLKLQMEVVQLLYAMTELPVPDDVSDYRSPIRASRHGGEITLSKETFVPLLAALKLKQVA